MEKETEVVIVGGGLAGLLLARRLQMAGVEATLVEKNASAGGCNATLEIAGDRHPIANYKALGLGNLDRLFADEPAGARRAPLRMPYCDHVFLPDLDVRLPAAPRELVECLGAAFPAEREGIARFVATIQELYEQMNAPAPGPASGGARLLAALAKHDRTPYRDFLHRLISDERLRAVLSVRVFSSGNTLLTMAGYLGQILFDGLYYLPGAGGELVRRLVAALSQPGSPVRMALGRAACRILFDGEARANGVRFDDGTVWRASRVVLGADVGHVARDLIRESEIRDGLLEAVAGVPAGLSALCLILAMRPEFQARLRRFEGVARVFYSDTYDLTAVVRSRESSLPDRSAFKVNFDWPEHDRAPAVLHLEFDCGFDDPELHDRRRLERGLLERALPALERIFGACEAFVTDVRLVTPHDLARLTNSARGSGSGWRDGCRPRHLERRLTRHGLLQVGQWSRFGSGVAQLDRSAAAAFEAIRGREVQAPVTAGRGRA